MSGLEERVIKEGQRGHGGWGARLSGKKGGITACDRRGKSSIKRVGEGGGIM